MGNLEFRIKLIVLWFFLAIGFSAYTTLDTIRPGILDEMISGSYEGIPLSEGLVLFFTLYWLVPSTMAFLCLIMKGPAIRWANIVLGIFWIGFTILDLFEGGLFFAQLLINVSFLVVAALIIWYSWNWPKPES